MNLKQKTEIIQHHYGTAVDGIFGNQTADAIIAKEGIATPAPTPAKIRVCIDPGHGMSNRKPGVYDPGCVDDGLDDGLDESRIVMDWALVLGAELAELNIDTWFTRLNSADPCPVSTRASRAVAAGCTHLISIHVNDADSPEANGTETLYNAQRTLAEKVQFALLNGLELKDRGTKLRTDLAVLKFPGPCCLIELGFIQSPTDRAAFLDPAKRKRTCELIAKVFQP